MSLATTDVTVEPGTSPLSVTGSSVSVSNFPATQPVSGSISVSNFPATQPVSGTVTSNQGTAAAAAGSWPVEVTDGTNILGTVAHPIQVAGTVITTPSSSSTATITRIATSGSAVTLLAANAARKQVIIVTETGTSNYIAYGSTATITNYTYFLGATATLTDTVWKGSISLIRSSGTGSVQVTELT